MSSIGSPLDTSILQAAQAQQAASKARDKEKAASDRARRSEDLLELRVAGLESAEAVRKLPQNDSEQAEAEHQAQDQLHLHGRNDDDGGDGDGDRPRVDLQA